MLALLSAILLPSALVYGTVIYFTPTVRNAAALLMNVFLKGGLMGYEDDEQLEDEIRRGNIEGADALELWDMWACNLRLRSPLRGMLMPRVGGL